MINVKGCGVLATALKQEVKGAWLSNQSPRVQAWASRYESDKLARKAELKTIGKEVANAEVKFASKAQRRVITIEQKVTPKPSVIRVKCKLARGLRLNPHTNGVEIYRSRMYGIKRELWARGLNTWVPAWYKFFGDYPLVRDNRVIARDVAFMKDCVKGMGLRY